MAGNSQNDTSFGHAATDNLQTAADLCHIPHIQVCPRVGLQSKEAGKRGTAAAWFHISYCQRM